MLLLLRYLRPKCGICCRRLVRSSGIPQLYLELLVFHAKNSTDSAPKQRGVLDSEENAEDSISQYLFIKAWQNVGQQVLNSREYRIKIQANMCSYIAYVL